MPPAHATATTLKRIHREIADLKKEDLGAIQLAPSDDDLFHWTASIPGPEGSVYEGGNFQVDIVLGHDYPFSAPRMTFRTRIYHMNINERGSICIDILKHNWSPALSLFKVILSLSSLLTDPNPKDPLVPSIATEYTRNRAQHDREARRWTELYARPQPVKEKGKGKASPSPTSVSATTTETTTTAAGRSNALSRTGAAADAAAITIGESDDDAPVTRSRAARSRAVVPVLGTKRKRAAPTTSVDIDLSTEDDVAQRRVSKRRAGGGSSTSGALGREDVIVIED